MPTFGSLFAGIGGIDLGLERAGWKCRWQVEWDAYCQHVLAHHWPDVPRYGDITAVDWSAVEQVDLIAGGFPCQPISDAGLRLAQADERWLWPEFARAVRALRPKLVLVENVAALLGRGLGDVLGDLSALGYDAEWDCLPAYTVGAPHERDRLWLVAYRDGLQPERRRGSGGLGGSSIAGTGQGPERQRLRDATGDRGSALADIAGDRRSVTRRGGLDGEGPARTDDPRRRSWALADPNAEHGERIVGGGTREEVRQEPDERPVGLRRGGRRQLGEAQSRMVRAPDGLPDWLDGHRWPAPPGPQYEWEPPRTVGKGVPNRARRVKALGNAVVPQVVEVIGRQLLASLEAVA